MTIKASFMEIRIRTESSEQYSISGHELMGIQHSFQSIQMADQSISSFIQQLQKHQDNEFPKELKPYSSRSQSYILVKEDQSEGKKKYLTMKRNKRNNFSLEKVNQYIMSQVLSYQRCLNIAKNDVFNRAYGAMFGFVIGDAMGAHVVNLSITQKEINQALLLNGGGVMNLLSGQCTDEWEICLALSQALIECKDYYDTNKVAEKYLEWLDSCPIDLPVLFGIAFSEIKKKRLRTGTLDLSTIGEQLAKDSARNSKQQSNLGLIRLIPLVIWTLNLEQYIFNQIIKQQMKLITPNQFVQQTALVYANILRCILITGDHMLAFHQASQYIYNFGSQKMIDLWSYIEERSQPIMTTGNAQNLKFPFIYAINQLLQIEKKGKDFKKQFVQCAVRIIERGFNTDTNCSIGLGLVGAIIGYNNIPSYFRSKILNSSAQHSKKQRKRDYHSKRVIDIVSKLLSQGPLQMQAYNF